jgi:hypothetical protein
MDLNNLDGLNVVAEEAVKNLTRFFQSDIQHTDKDMKVARIAGTVLSSWARAHSARGSQQALHFQMARELAGNRETLQRYVRFAFPDSALGMLTEVSPSSGGAKTGSDESSQVSP